MQKVEDLSAGSDQRGDGDGEEKKEEFGTGIKFSLDPWTEPDLLSSSESEEEEEPEREINLRYEGETIFTRQSRRDKDSGVGDGRDSIDTLWLQKHVSEK